MKKGVGKVKKTKTKSYEKFKDFAIAVLAVVVLVVIAVNVKSLKIGSSEAFWPNPSIGNATSISAPTPRMAYPEFKADNAGLSTTLLSGTANDLYQFTVTAKGGAVALKKFAFNVQVIDQDVAGPDADIGGFYLLVDGVTMVDTDILSWPIGATYPVNAEVKGVGDVEGYDRNGTRVVVQFGGEPSAGGEMIIGKNQTKTFALRGITGSGFVPGDHVICFLAYDPSGSASKQYLNDYDLRVGHSLTMRKSQYGEPRTFEIIWSDLSSGSSHSSKFDDLGVQTLSSNDWWGGLLKYFPMPTRIITA